MRQRGRSKLNMQIREEACEWFIESRAGDMNEAMRAEFDRWLRTSPEHALKRLVASGVGDCYEIGRVFRNGVLPPAEA